MGPDSRRRAFSSGARRARTRSGQERRQQKSDLPGKLRGAAAGVFLRRRSSETLVKSHDSRARHWHSMFAEFASYRALPLHSVLPAAQSGAALSGVRVEILDLRHFSSADLRPLLEDEVRLWANLLCWDYSGSAEMILRYMDAQFLPRYT